MILREFLYADTDKIRSLIAQLDNGVPEESRMSERLSKRTGIGIRRVASLERDQGEELVVQRSLLDVIFPQLEEILESEDALTDLSEELQQPDFWLTEAQKRFPPGSFVRISAPAKLFDARYVASIMSGISASMSGILSISGEPVTKGPKASTARPKPPRPKAQQQEPSTNLEDSVIDFSASDATGGLSSDQLRAFIRIARGMFIPGLHLMMSPIASHPSYSILARLPEGMRHLDSSPEILFARYGLAAQDWTMVGTIGAYATSEQPKIEPFVNPGRGEFRIERSAFIEYVNNLMQYISSMGFADVPEYPGFSFVPFAVYRSVNPATLYSQP